MQQSYISPKGHISLLKITSTLCTIQTFLSVWCLTCSSVFDAGGTNTVGKCFGLSKAINIYLLLQNISPFMLFRLQWSFCWVLIFVPWLKNVDQLRCYRGCVGPVAPCWTIEWQLFRYSDVLLKSSEATLISSVWMLQLLWVLCRHVVVGTNQEHKPFLITLRFPVKYMVQVHLLVTRPTDVLSVGRRSWVKPLLAPPLRGKSLCQVFYHWTKLSCLCAFLPQRGETNTNTSFFNNVNLNFLKWERVGGLISFVDLLHSVDFFFF